MARRQATAPSEVIDIGGMRVEVMRKRVKNLNLRVRRDGSVAVSARPGIDTATIAAFVSSKADWIERAQRRVAERQEARELRCAEGSTVRLWGETLTCRIEPCDQVETGAPCAFRPEDGLLRVRCTAACQGDDEASALIRERELAQWLSDALKQAALEVLPECEGIVGRCCTLLRLRRMTSRWGSCNTRTAAITLNTELVHYPHSCLRYILIHELCHLREPNHGPRFHDLMDRFCPDWREQRALLEAH